MLYTQDKGKGWMPVVWWRYSTTWYSEEKCMYDCKVDQLKVAEVFGRATQTRLDGLTFDLHFISVSISTCLSIYHNLVPCTPWSDFCPSLGWSGFIFAISLSSMAHTPTSFRPPSLWPQVSIQLVTRFPPDLGEPKRGVLRGFQKAKGLGLLRPHWK